MQTFLNQKDFKMPMASKGTEIRMFGDHYPNIYHKLSYNFPHYYKIYFNVTYCLLITPFRVSFKDNSAKMITNPIQTVLCAVVNGLVCALALLWIRRDASVKVKDQPDILFTIANNCAWMWYMLLYVMVFWSKRTQSLLKIPYKPSNLKVNIKGILMICLAFFTVLLYYVVFVVFDEHFQVQPFLDNFATTALHMTYQHRNKSYPIAFDQLTTSQQAIVASVFVVDFFFNTIIGFLELFGLISTIAVYEMTSSFSPIFLKNKYGDIRVLLQHYADMKDVFGRINTVNGPILLIIFVQIIPWISSSLIEILDDDKWPNKVYMIFYYWIYVGLLGFAAESNHKAKIFKKRIYAVQKLEMDKKDFFGNQSSYVTNFMKGTEGATALAGGKFFFVTYSFIGASVSVLVTFSMIMVQFKTSTFKPIMNFTIDG